jgi:hypothetical protein
MRFIRNPCIQNEALLIVKAGGTYSYHWVLSDNITVYVTDKALAKLLISRSLQEVTFFGTKLT